MRGSQAQCAKNKWFLNAKMTGSKARISALSAGAFRRGFLNTHSACRGSVRRPGVWLNAMCWRSSRMAGGATVRGVAVGGPCTRVHAIDRPYDRDNAPAHHAANAGNECVWSLNSRPPTPFSQFGGGPFAGATGTPRPGLVPRKFCAKFRKSFSGPPLLRGLPKVGSPNFIQRADRPYGSLHSGFEEMNLHGRNARCQKAKILWT